MQKPGLDQVIKAINTLYNEPGSQGKEEASRWLGELQNSIFAWEIADLLLGAKLDTTTCYFGAQTMRTKIQYFFHELQPSQYESLKNSLLNHVIKFHGSAQAVINQLCLAIADLAVQMPQWTDPVRDLIERFSKSIETIPDLLEMLQYLTEEVNSEHLHVGANRREELINQLRQSSLVVIQLLNACLEQCPNEPEIRTKIFCCFGAWLLLGAFPLNEVMKSRLLPSLFEALIDEKSDDKLQEAAADTLCQAIYSAQELEPQNQMTDALFSEVLKLLPLYEQARVSDNQDRCINFCRVFTELAESTLDASASTKGRVQLDARSVHLMVECVQHSDYEVAEITFNYWYSLSEALFRNDLKVKQETFTHCYHSLFDQLCRLCKIDHDTEGIPSTQSDFGEFRSKVVDLVKDCVFMVGSSNLFLQLCERIIRDIGKVLWQEIEAQLFIMAAVAPNVTIETSDSVHTLFNILFNDPKHPTHVAVKFIAIKLIGELASWINLHPEVLSTSNTVLNILYEALSSKEFGSVAAESLQKVCSYCQKKMAQHFTILLQILQAIDTLCISAAAVLEFFQGVAKVLSELPREQIEEGMKQMCVQQVQLLTQLLAGRNGGHSDPVVFLDRIATVFRYTVVQVKSHEKHPCSTVVHELWPVLSETFNKYQKDDRIMERCCRCVRFIIRCLGEHFCPLLGQLVTQMVQVYSSCHHSCFLYLGSILVDEFGKDKNCVPGLIQMVEVGVCRRALGETPVDKAVCIRVICFVRVFNYVSLVVQSWAFSSSTFTFLNSNESFVQRPDTVDDLFRLCTRCVQTCPVEFLKCSVADSLIKCAIAGSTLSHREANASVMTFLRDLVHGPNDQYKGSDVDSLRNSIMQVMSNHGLDITIGLVQACAGKIPSYMVPNIGDVFWEMLRFNKTETSNWLRRALEMLPTQTASGTSIVTSYQLLEFHRDVTSAEECNVISRAARSFSRLYE